MKMNNDNKGLLKSPGIAWKKLLSVVAVGGIAIAPLVGAISIAEARPPQHAPAHGYRNRDDRRENRRERRGTRRDRRQERREDRRDDRRDRDRDDDWRDRNSNTRSFTGTVTRVHTGRSFDMRLSGDTFNVYTNSRLPRGLNRSDTVRVRGERYGANDIRNASVTLIRNR